MIKVFLVEDEFVVRQGIKKNIDWEANGYEFCGDAGDGEMAFPMIKKANPDIVITDIKMPFMDGLELSRLLKKEMPWIEIIILSGYEEFEYAKEGIKIGVAQYLTKPISGDDLLKELNQLSSKIEENKKEREIREKYKKEMEENRLREKNDLFKELVSGTKSVAQLMDMADRLDLNITAMWYNLVLLRVFPKDKNYESYSDEGLAIEKEIAELDAERNVIRFDRDLEGMAILFMADSEEELKKSQEEYLEKIREIFAKYDTVRYFGGVGTPVERLRTLADSYESASRAFAHQYLVDDSIIYQIAEKGTESLKQEDFNIANVEPKQMDRAKIRDFLRMGDSSEAPYFVEEFFNELGTNAKGSLVFRQYIMMDIYFCVAEFLEELQMPKEEAEALDVTDQKLQTEKGAMDYLTRVLQKAMSLRDRAASSHYQDVVDEVLQYIERNYADEELSLNLIASHVNFSPNHLSTVFGKQTGQTFIKYLTDYRMQKAKELLRCTGKRSSEVSLEVGYKDPHYFSYLFKKTQGMTPTQYRGVKGVEGEE